LKKIVKSRSSNIKSIDETIEIKRPTLSVQAKKLNEILETVPVNLTLQENKFFDCPTFAYGLINFFQTNEDALKMKIRKNLIKKQTKAQDLSWPIDDSYLKKQMEYFRCTEQIKTDRSFFYYLKYLLKSLRSLAGIQSEEENLSESSSNESVSVTSTTKTTSLTNNFSLSINDVAEIFYPYTETLNKCKKILSSHSYLNYLLVNYNGIFEKQEKCNKNVPKPKEKFLNFFSNLDKRNEIKFL
jgi:hypothetical protein